MNTTNSLADTRTQARIGTKKPIYKLTVLIACEESQAECEAFREWQKHLPGNGVKQLSRIK